MTTSISETDLRAAVRAEAAQLGFDAVGFADATAAWEAGDRLARFLAQGRHGTMDWMARTASRRAHPQALWPQARSAVVAAMNYGPDEDPLAALFRRSAGSISVYARGRDYHEVLKGRLKRLAGFVARRTAGEVKVFVDTAPLMEKPLAQRAGIGWQGKHTNLVSRTHGSWLFLGVVLTTAVFAPDAAERDHCGRCRACLDVCPTDAFPAPYQLDARACLSYLTIEHAGPIPERYRAPMGNRIFGCDDCLAICPWNKFAAAGKEAKLAARAELRAPDLAELAALAEAGFRRRFAANPVKRIGWPRFLRNVLYAIGNSGERRLAAAAAAHQGHASDIVREAAAWALARLEATVAKETGS